MLFKILGLPVSLPAAGIGYIFKTIADIADREMNDPEVLKEQLILLQMRLENGEIEEDEYVEQEAEIFQRMRELRERRKAEADEYAASLQAQPGEEPVPAGRRRAVIETSLDGDDSWGR